MELITLLIGGGLFAFIQWAVDKITDAFGKKNKTMKAIEELSKQITVLQETMDERDAVLARTHILRFNDELYNGIRHSREYFVQQLEDCDNYDKFCEAHPKFRNSRTTLASQNIKDTYNKLFDQHDFLS